MLIKVIEIVLLIITLFLLWLCCYPDYLGKWAKSIYKLVSWKRKSGNEEK